MFFRKINTPQKEVKSNRDKRTVMPNDKSA